MATPSIVNCEKINKNKLCSIDTKMKKSRAFLAKDLIKEVKCRPGIFDKEQLEYPRKVHKRRLWFEIAEILSGIHWTEFTENQKQARSDEIQQKWKHLRDHYLEAVKKEQSGTTSKKYVYYDELEFMRPFVGLKIRVVNKSRIDKSLNKFKVEKSERIPEPNRSDEYFEDEEEAYEPKEKQSKKHHKQENMQNRLNFSSISNSNSQSNSSFQLRDGDISFCLSLVPTLRIMKESQKIRAKMDLLKVLHRYIEHDERQETLAQHLIQRRVVEQEDRSNDTMHSDYSTFEEKPYSSTPHIKSEPIDIDNDKEWWT